MKNLLFILFLFIASVSTVVYGASVAPSGMTELASAPAVGDLFILTDVSDTTQSANGSTKFITFQNVMLAYDSDSDGYIDQASIEGFAASAFPGFTAYDSDAGDVEVGKLYWNYIDGAAGSENANFYLQSVVVGSEFTWIASNVTDDRIEVYKTLNLASGETYSINGSPIAVSSLADGATIADQTTVGIDAGDTYTHFGSAGDDTINELNAAIDEALIRCETFSIVEPDQVQGITDDVVLKHFMADAFPNGAVITDIAISSSSAYTSETFLVEEWDVRAGSTQSTVESITISSQYQEDDGTLSDGAMAADSFLVVNLDDTPEDKAEAEITIVYYRVP